jgi:hypothetical protein
MNNTKSQTQTETKKDLKKDGQINSEFKKSKTPLETQLPDPAHQSTDEHPYPNDLYKEKLPPEAQMQNNESRYEQVQ